VDASYYNKHYNHDSFEVKFALHTRSRFPRLLGKINQPQFGYGPRFGLQTLPNQLAAHFDLAIVIAVAVG
jgi:hypothetical protein